MTGFDLHGKVAIVSGASRGIGEAITHFGPLLDAELWQWDKILEVNVKGTFWLCQIAARQMIAQGDGGKIITRSQGLPCAWRQKRQLSRPAPCLQ